MFKHRLHELGRADIAFEFRWAEGDTERLAAAAAELVGFKVDVLVTAGTPAAAAASRATSDIPIVMATGVGLGTQLTAGSERRNANVTGISDLPPGVSAKRLQLLREALPGAAALAILADRGNPSSPLAVRETQAAAQALGHHGEGLLDRTRRPVRRGIVRHEDRRHRRLRRRAGRVVLRAAQGSGGIARSNTGWRRLRRAGTMPRPAA